MKLTASINQKEYSADLQKGRSISTPFLHENASVKAFHAPDIQIEAVRMGDFVGSTTEGGILNFKNLMINPHGNGTHTECVGHIATEPFYIKDCLQESHTLGILVTVQPENINEDSVVTLNLLQSLTIPKEITTLIIRTLPNLTEDKLKNWTETNPTYIEHQAMSFLVEQGIQHFMIDVPSVDREHDEGKLLAHKTFWNYPGSKPRKNATITEMVYVPNEISDGYYLVNLQILPLSMDASPSNIVLFTLHESC